MTVLRRFSTFYETIIVQGSECKTKNQQPRNGRGTKGFTLLEVLIAMGIMSVIVTVIYSSFSTASRNVEQAEAMRDANDLAQTLVEKLFDDITNAYVNPVMIVPTIFYGKKVQPEPGDDAKRYDELYLTTLTNERAFNTKEMDLWEVGYFFKQKSDGSGFVMWRREKKELSKDVPALEGGDEYELTDRVNNLQFRYNDGAKWSDEWTSKTTVPKVVEISLTLAGGPTYTTQVKVGR